MEEYDFALHEISKPTDSSSLETSSPLFGRLVQDWPTWDLQVVNRALDYLYNHHLQNVHEQPLLPLEAYRAAFGFSRQEFTNVRAALFALASFSNGLHLGAAQERDQASDGETKTRYHQEFLEWNAPLLTKDFVYSCLSRLTKLSRDRLIEILSPFSLDVAAGDFKNAGDGYLPPLVLYQDSVLFNPHVVRMMMHERNILYVLNKRDRDRFNNIVSQHLEPVLLQEALHEFARTPAWLIKRNVIWKDGEIDLLVFDPASNTALQVQAKAAMSAQNARMTRQLEDHTIRAVAQINKLKELQGPALDTLLSRVFDRKISDATLISAVLSRSGLGTWRSWSALGEAVALNIPLLRETLRLIAAEPGTPLPNLPGKAVNVLNDWARRAAKGWRRADINLLGRTITFPVIESNDREISGIKIRLGLIQ